MTTLKKLNNLPFIELYNKLLLNNNISSTEYQAILSLAIILLNQEEDSVKQWGYRMIVLFSNQTKNYVPLYEIALQLGLYPISKCIESDNRYKEYLNNKVIGSFSSSSLELYKHDTHYLTEQQCRLRKFNKDQLFKTTLIIAPTSYGKSELIISMLRGRKRGNICIIVPTKSLLAQTKQRIVGSKIPNLNKIITHPEMYNGKEKDITAVLTQERLLRLLKKNPELNFVWAIVDEAHNLLNGDQRNILLASVLLILHKRNPRTIIKFYSPFIENEGNLTIKYTDYAISTHRITETVKTEKIYICDINRDKLIYVYDQFTDKKLLYENNLYDSDIDLIFAKKGRKNIIYLNKPVDLQEVALGLSRRVNNVNSTVIEKACRELSNYIHIDYNLIDCLKKGIVYHHGSVPDIVRIYIEFLFRTESTIQFVVTTSTLLEGVNLPAEKMFILDNKKGSKNLSPSQFRNLIGRVCRFNEIFKKNDECNLEMLEPQIFIVKSQYMSDNANVDKFIKTSIKADNVVKDEPKNILLNCVNISESNTEEINKAKEFIENFEKNTIPDYDLFIAETQIGKLCYNNGINEIDLLLNEREMQRIYDRFVNSEGKLGNANDVVEMMRTLFIPFIANNEENNQLKRIEEKEATDFYAMLLNWRIENTSLSEMISSFMKYWAGLEKNGRPTLVYVGKWGDEVREGYRKLWTDIQKKSRKQRINLAIVRIKEEYDFIDNVLIKFIEAMNDLLMIEDELYEKIKYGTNDPYKIILIKNGLSLSLANLMINKYKKYVSIDISKNIAAYDSRMIEQMKINMESDLHIFEAKYNMVGQNSSDRD